MDEQQKNDDHLTSQRMSRRDFLTRSVILISGIGGVVAALSPLRALESTVDAQEYFQKHYKELSADEMDHILKRIADKVEGEYGVRPNMSDHHALDEVEFCYALNLSRCIGCRKCVHACVGENNQSRSPEIQYIRVLRIPDGTMDLEESEHYYDPETVPQDGYYYMPVQCHQCRRAPCVMACPVKATWIEPDGVTVIDYNWCIGCRYCEAACPYWARRFNFAKPYIPKDRLNLDMGYLSNRPRPKGVVEKCHLCLHRTRDGRLPACVEVCPTGSRKFGNVLDPNSPVSIILKSKRVFIFKADVGTLPRFYYYFDK